MNKTKKINIIINIIALIVIICIFIYVYLRFKDDFYLLKTEQGRSKLIDLIQGTGIYGSLILILIQSLQVIVAFIPGEFVEIISGAMFGPIGGLIICLIGLNLGTIIIFLLVRWLGKPFINTSPKDEYKRLTFLNDSTRAYVILFFIFLLPGIPKDILIFLIPLTKLKMGKFMIVSSVARIPSIISSTIIGNSLIEENYLIAVVTFIIFFILGLLGLIFNKQISNFIVNKTYNKKANNNR